MNSLTKTHIHAHVFTDGNIDYFGRIWLDEEYGSICIVRPTEREKAVYWMRVGLQVHESKVHEIFESPFMESWTPMNTDQTNIKAAQMSPSYQCDSPRPTSPSYQ